MSDSSCWMSVFDAVIECLLASDHLVRLKFLFPSTLPENPQLTTITYGSLHSHSSQQETPTSSTTPAWNQLSNEMNVAENEEARNENVDINELTLNNTQFSFYFWV